MAEDNPNPWDERPQDPVPPASPSVPQTTDRKVRVTFKAAGGHEAPWITVDGTDIADAADQLSDTDSVKRLVEMAVSAARFLHRSYGPSQRNNQSASGSPSEQRQTGKPTGATEAPNGEKRYCEHGQRVYKSGFSEKTGRNWAAFDCPDGKCGREWANTRK
ncbi:hypothetical protein ACFQ1S_03430 [Kibdelosporangium lantanae]|uniref:Uncharacterized protein n=1 Tax=Kibdelosporangium lantanae TaxID=1497396 RepID=A0ABW3M6V7_9PSEU